MKNMKNAYPKCATTFKNWYKSNVKYEEIYKKIGCPIPFDVTLRDGLQSLSKEEQLNFTTRDKLNMYYGLTSLHNIKNIEIGSIVSKSILPVFHDTINFYDKIRKYEFNNDNNPNNYILIPNRENLKKVIDNTDIHNFSFITSVSNSFQLKNTKMTLKDSDDDINGMLSDLYEKTDREKKPKIKLYVSCVTECPLQGKIDNDYIIHRLLNLNKMNVNNICISDTCGTLDVDDFEYIVETCMYFGLPSTKLSLHLHVKPGREYMIEKIMYKALNLNINNFDVSALESGGCSVTMDKTKLKPNLSYDLYYSILCNYISMKSELLD
jgi:hydroxymethylglutaryl-CoA lyase